MLNKKTNSNIFTLYFNQKLEYKGKAYVHDQIKKGFHYNKQFNLDDDCLYQYLCDYVGSYTDDQKIDFAVSLIRTISAQEEINFLKASNFINLISPKHFIAGLEKARATFNFQHGIRHVIELINDLDLSYNELDTYINNAKMVIEYNNFVPFILNKYKHIDDLIHRHFNNISLLYPLGIFDINSYIKYDGNISTLIDYFFTNKIIGYYDNLNNLIKSKVSINNHKDEIRANKLICLGFAEQKTSIDDIINLLQNKSAKLFLSYFSFIKPYLNENDTKLIYTIYQNLDFSKIQRDEYNTLLKTLPPFWITKIIQQPNMNFISNFLVDDQISAYNLFNSLEIEYPIAQINIECLKNTEFLAYMVNKCIQNQHIYTDIIYEYVIDSSNNFYIDPGLLNLFNVLIGLKNQMPIQNINDIPNLKEHILDALGINGRELLKSINIYRNLNPDKEDMDLMIKQLILNFITPEKIISYNYE